VVTRIETHFAGHQCVRLGNEALALWVTRSVGPRIIGLALRGGKNLLAELPDEVADLPGGGAFHFYGGHRLWYGPEDLRRTYLPDDAPVAIADVEDGVLVTPPVEAQTGIEKSLTIAMPSGDARVVIDHTIQKWGRQPIELAPWAITQLVPGGVAILPQPTTPTDEHGLLPNRSFALWPYTAIDSGHIAWGDRYLFVEAAMTSGALKIGFPNPLGWMGYAVQGSLFVKHAAYRPDDVYLDRGSSRECYCNPRFLELETLGPLTTLAPGESATHRETWAIYAGVSVDPDEASVEALAAELGLGSGEGRA
jgi:hypothetical protein